MQRIAAYGLVVERNVYALQQTVVALQHTQAAAAHGVLARCEGVFEVHGISSRFVVVSRIAIALGVEGAVMVFVRVRNEVAVGVHHSVKCPTHDVPFGILDYGVVCYLTINAAKVGCGAIFGSHFPRVVCGQVAPADDARKATLNQRFKTLILCPAWQFGCTISAVAQFRSHQQVALTLMLDVETWYTPARLNVHTLHGQAPTITHVRRPAIAAILQTHGGLHAAAPFGQLEGVAQRCRSALVGRGRIHRGYARCGVCGFQFGNTRWHIVLRFGTLRHLDDAVYHVGEVRSLGHHHFPFPIQGLMAKHRPLALQLIIIIGVYVVCRIALRDERAVVGYGDGCRRMHEMLAVRQQAVACHTTFQRCGNGHIPIARNIHHACWQVGQFALTQWRYAQQLGPFHTTTRNMQLGTPQMQRVGRIACEEFAHCTTSEAAQAR